MRTLIAALPIFLSPSCYSCVSLLSFTLSFLLTFVPFCKDLSLASSPPSFLYPDYLSVPLLLCPRPRLDDTVSLSPYLSRLHSLEAQAWVHEYSSTWLPISIPYSCIYPLHVSYLEVKQRELQQKHRS